MRKVTQATVVVNELNCEGCKRRMLAGMVCYRELEVSGDYYCPACVDLETMTLKIDATAKAPKGRRMMLERISGTAHTQCTFCKAWIADGASHYMRDERELCLGCGDLYNAGFLAGRGAPEAPKPDDGPVYPEFAKQFKDALVGAGVTMSEDTNFWMWAATVLKIPKSGNDRLDDMIRESRRNELAGLAMQGDLASCHYSEGQLKDMPDIGEAGNWYYKLADAMLAASGKGGE